jgi:hypothetical protein
MAEPFEFVYERNRVEFDGAVLAIGGTGFPLDQIERLGRSILHSKAQGSWNRLTADISVWANGERGSVTFNGDASTEEWGPWRPLWDQLAAMVHDEIEPRLLRPVLTKLMDGGTVELCSLRGAGRGRIEASSEAYKERKPLAKPIPWRAIVDVAPAPGVPSWQFQVADASGKVKSKLTGTNVAEWDAWMIPLLWKVFRSR